MAIEKEPFEGARFRVESPRLTAALTREKGPSTHYCTTEAERDALVRSVKDIRGRKATVTDLMAKES